MLVQYAVLNYVEYVGKFSSSLRYHLALTCRVIQLIGAAGNQLLAELRALHTWV